MASIKLPDGSVKEFADGVTVGQVAESIGRGLAKAAIVGKVDGKLVDLSHPLSGSHDLQIITDKSPEGLYVMRHSTAHVLAQALRRLYGPQFQYTIGPVIENGFFYDFEFPKGVSFSADDLPRVEKEMQKIVEENVPFQREDVEPATAKQILHSQEQRFKDEIIDGLVEKGEKTVSIYRQGDFTDLCIGPHVPSTGKIKAFKLQSVAGAYWRGDSNREQLTRVYGTAFFDKAELDKLTQMQEEAKKRDHRVLGPQLGLFTIDEQVGQGLVLWKPKGAIVRLELQKFISEHLSRQGYSQVFTPHIGRLDLYRTSGHYPYYRESQFPPLVDREFFEKLAKENCGCGELSNRMEKGEIDGYLLKPMNCPMHIRIFASEPRSYRGMPVRLAEFGTVYRWEKSGELGGMTRVRGFTQDDAHLFVTEEQLSAELMGCLELVKIVFNTLGMHDYRVRVGLRDPDSAKYVGETAQWDKAEKACTDAAASLGVPFTTEPGEAAFYGPKIDFVVKDVIGREWQLGTVQVDYQLPQRFDLSYTGADNKPHRPVMIHRAPFGSMERFIGVLIEHFAGAFPLWLAPEQVRVLTISEKFVDYAKEVEQALKAEGMRAEGDYGPDKVGAKIRDAALQKIPYMLIIGEQEAAARGVSVRPRGTADQNRMPLTEFIQRCRQELATRGATPAVPA
ncbi:MAG TPA: threonine--tRNA ligase [Tepidisphaeraceae bacterium]|jgi:threonyl-tRNA synthetase|nr:threonine--tRNA ligase [Tepidisphaeraceae bacterium]